jgi:hypothetical protein
MGQQQHSAPYLRLESIKSCSMCANEELKVVKRKKQQEGRKKKKKKKKNLLSAAYNPPAAPKNAFFK